MKIEKQTTYNKLRQILTDRLPHLKELSFGCEIEVDYNDEPNLVSVHTIRECIYENGEVRYIGTCDNNNWYTNDWRELKKEIIGHPPTLQDVLLAIDKKYEGSVFITISPNGFIETSGLKEDTITYNLNLPLSQQSDETLLEIIKLIE